MSSVSMAYMTPDVINVESGFPHTSLICYGVHVHRAVVQPSPLPSESMQACILYHNHQSGMHVELKL